jgi:GGDEF domain-containing protein
VVLAERIRSTVENTPIEYDGHVIHISISLGFAVAENQTLADYPAMYATAASALGAAKRQGRNRSVIRSMQVPTEQAPTAST